MQRKNYLLRKSGFAMIMAIAVIVIISTIMALSLSMTAETTKRTTDLYIYEQAVLLSKSAAEYALLQISQNQPCTDEITLGLNNFKPDLNSNGNIDDDFYNIDIKIKYIYDSNTSCIANGGTFYTNVTTPEQNGSVLMDITVSVTDENITSEPIRYFRRSIQKL
ncbi:MAG: hypothetical protein Q7S59_06150 [Sulfurimonas sp.]|nr:hypothetical protein [Sulfurimonas sp.]